MKKVITKKSFAILLLVLSLKTNAQQWLGRTTGNYTGTYGLYNNASSIADSKYKYYVNLWGTGTNFYNNYLWYNSPVRIGQIANGNYDPSYMNEDGKLDFQKDWLIEDLNGKTKQLSYNRDIWGPSFMFPISKAVNMSINTRQRSSSQMFGISEPIARMMYNGVDSSGGLYDGNNGLNRNQYYSNGKFGSNIQSNQELSFSFAGILAKNDHHQLTGGATAKFIRGLGAAYLKGNGFDMAITGDNSASLSNADLQYAYTDEKSITDPFKRPYGLFSLKSMGAGAGVDLGITYTYTANKGKYADSKYCNTDNLKSDYDVKLALAFNDLGNVRYNQNSYQYNYTGSGNLNVPSNFLDAFNQPKQNGFDTVGKYIFEQLGSTKSLGFNSSLPAAFNFQADFRFNKHFYTAVYLNQSLKSINSTGMKSTSMLSIIPRIEKRDFEFSMPLTLSENYKNFYIGAYMRLGPLFIGSDNLGGLFKVAGNNQFRGADFYGGVSFGIGNCPRYNFEDKVVPTDTVTEEDSVVKKDSIIKKDTIQKKDIRKIFKPDTVKIIETDTIRINQIVRDTIYIDKTAKSKIDIAKEKELKNRETAIIIRQRKVEQRERILIEKEKNSATEITKCKDQNNSILTANTALKNKVSMQSDTINKLYQLINDLNKNKSINDAEIVRLNKEKAKAENDARIAARKADSLQIIYNTIVINFEECQKNNYSKNDAKIVSAKMKAENDAKIAQVKADSLQKRLEFVTLELNNCKKANSSSNQAEIVKVKIEKLKAENDAKAAIKKADSLQLINNTIFMELKDCKNNNNSKNEAEIVKAKNKAENDAKAAIKKADSLQVIYNAILIELKDCKNNNNSKNEAEIVKAKSKAETEAKNAIKKADSLQVKYDALYNIWLECKKNNSENEATVVRLKKTEADLALYKAELDAINKTHLVLNAKIYQRDATIDSLLAALAGCGSKNNNSEYDALIKKCNDSKAEMNEEIINLKGRIINANRALDSMTVVAANLKKDKSSLDAQNVELKSQNTALISKVNTLSNELLALRAEYQLLINQNINCTKKLDSCMRGLLDTNQEPTEPGNKEIEDGKGKGGPVEGSTENNDEFTFNKTIQNFGAVNPGDILESEFILKNTGKVPLQILSHTSESNYVIPKYSTEPVPAGESTIITIRYNTVIDKGSQTKKINLITSSRNEVLTLQCFVREKSDQNTSTPGGNGNSTGTTTTSSGLGWKILKAVIENSTTNSSHPIGGSGTGTSKSGTGVGTNTGSGTSTKTNSESGMGGSSGGTTRSPSGTNTSTRRR